MYLVLRIDNRHMKILYIRLDCLLLLQQVFKTHLTPKACELLEDIKKIQNGRRRLVLESSFDGEHQRDKR